MIAKLIIVGWTVLLGSGLVWNLSQSSIPPDGNDAATAGWLFGMFFVIILHLIVWLVVALPTYVISRMFRRNQEAI